VPLHTIRADVDFGQAEAATTFGRIGVKAWIYRGDVIPERKTAGGGEDGDGASGTPAVTVESGAGGEA
jgi:small subunit ribosomal protein S3